MNVFLLQSNKNQAKTRDTKGEERMNNIFQCGTKVMLKNEPGHGVSPEVEDLLGEVGEIFSGAHAEFQCVVNFHGAWVPCNYEELVLA